METIKLLSLTTQSVSMSVKVETTLNMEWMQSKKKTLEHVRKPSMQANLSNARQMQKSRRSSTKT